ncbi:type 1 glutamine amidotransferase [Geomicrobium sp. JCM 19039]|uniref:type 1 glutamine amidotransferase n=1 Tax=Geomicrobium sp. JCM 19039 TaxID=1460636 RepID=UPI00045F1487|nr:type 1 glutamine amidotransferase [Geomicrobium sp. JCM 19039]GAK10438.1 glutamine amidotransferase [Geomicrobium sp. JCM 19039]
MTVLVIQPSNISPLGDLETYIVEEQIPYTSIQIERGEVPPTSDAGFTALIVLGGEMSVNDKALYSFIESTQQLIRMFHEKSKPILGICLGGQMIASAFSASITRMPTKEFGLTLLHKTSSANSDPLFFDLPKRMKFMQYHEDVFSLPTEALQLCSGDVCEQQAFRIGSKTYALQFHPEVNARIASEWVEHFGQQNRRVEKIDGSDLAEAQSWAAHLFRRWLTLV